MIVLNDLVVKANKIEQTESGEVEIPGGFFAEFSVDNTEEVLVPINEETFNTLMDIRLNSDPIIKHNRSLNLGN